MEAGPITILQELLQRFDASYDDKKDMWVGWGDARRYVVAINNAIQIVRWYDEYAKERSRARLDANG